MIWGRKCENGDFKYKSVDSERASPSVELVLDIENYAAWRSDLSKTEVISDKQFIEYTKDGYPTTFTVTVVDPYRRWEFDMENSNMKGHWTAFSQPRVIKQR